MVPDQNPVLPGDVAELVARRKGIGDHAVLSRRIRLADVRLRRIVKPVVRVEVKAPGCGAPDASAVRRAVVVRLFRLVVEQTTRLAVEGGRHAPPRGHQQNVLRGHQVSLRCNSAEPAGQSVGQVDVDVAAGVVRP